MGDKRSAGLSAGMTVGGRYRIVRKIGEGGMGCVYLAEDLRLMGQRWAVKWIRADEAAPFMPEHEATIMTSLQHESLPRIVDYFVEDETHGRCLVMDYLEGETLLERSAASGHALPWEQAVQYALQLCDLLDYLHSLDSPIIFRDIKPSNVIIGRDNRVRLIDFGIARTYKAGQASDTVHIGSIGFAAPELLSNRQTDHRADLYSLGCLLYFLLSGGQFYNFNKRAIEEVAEGVPTGLALVLESLLAEEPERRFADARTAKQAFIQLLKPGGSKGESDHSRIAKEWGGRRRIVTVFGLFSKSGATFVSVALAKLLAQQGGKVCYNEFPWSNGDSFLRMQSMIKGGGTEWQDGEVIWRIATRDEHLGVEPYETVKMYKLLFEAKGDVAIFDVSAATEKQAVHALIQVSDLVVAVAAPDPAGLRSREAVDNWSILNMADQEERICWVANRMPESIKLAEFFKLFSMEPTGVVPEFNYDRMMKAKWDGRWLIDEPDIRKVMQSSLKSLIQLITPELQKGQTGLKATVKKTAKKWLASKRKNGYNVGNNKKR